MEEERTTPLDGVRAWSASQTATSPTHRELMERLRGYVAGTEADARLLCFLEGWDSAIEQAQDGLQASADACDQLSAAAAEAIERGLLSMHAYRLELSSLRALALDGDREGAAERLEPLQGLHMAVREAHEHLGRVSPPDAVSLALSDEGARTENLWRLHLVLQAFLNGRASVQKARASVRWLTERFEQAASATVPEVDESGANAAETLEIAYREGLSALARLDATLPARDPATIAAAWERLEDAFAQIRQGQGLCRDLEDEIGIDAWIEE